MSPSYRVMLRRRGGDDIVRVHAENRGEQLLDLGDAFRFVPNGGATPRNGANVVELLEQDLSIERGAAIAVAHALSLAVVVRALADIAIDLGVDQGIFSTALRMASASSAARCARKALSFASLASHLDRKSSLRLTGGPLSSSSRKMRTAKISAVRMSSLSPRLGLSSAIKFPLFCRDPTATNRGRPCSRFDP